MDEDDVSCAVCLEVFVLPTALPCRHIYCRPCLLSLVPRSASCPLCRSTFGLPLHPVDASTEALVARFRREQEEALRGVVAAAVLAPLLRRDEWLVVLRMLEKLEGARAVARVGAVCKGLYRVAQDSFLWRDLCMRDFAFVPSDEDGSKPSWRRRYDAAKRRVRGWDQGKPSDWKLTTLRGPASHVVRLFAGQGRRVAVRYADGTAVSWDTRSEQQSPDDGPAPPPEDGASCQVAADRFVRRAGAAVQLVDGAGTVLASAAAAAHNGAPVRPSYDSGHALFGGSALQVFAVSSQVGVLICCRFLSSHLVRLPSH